MTDFVKMHKKTKNTTEESVVFYVLTNVLD